MGAAKSSPSRSRARALRPADTPPSHPRRPANNAAAVADYVASITAELAALAGSARLDLLTYFLNMARLEAEFHARQNPPQNE